MRRGTGKKEAGGGVFYSLSPIWAAVSRALSLAFSLPLLDSGFFAFLAPFWTIAPLAPTLSEQLFPGLLSVTASGSWARSASRFQDLSRCDTVSSLAPPDLSVIIAFYTH